MAVPPASVAGLSHDGRNSGAFSNQQRPLPSTALLIEYYEGVANKGSNMPSVRVKVNPYMNDNQQQNERTSYLSNLPTRENTVIHHNQNTEAEEGGGNSGGYEQRQDDTTSSAPLNFTPTRGRERTRAVSGQTTGPVDEEEEEPLPTQPYRTTGRREFSDPQSLLTMGSNANNDIVSSRQFQAIIASAIQELILPEIQAVRNELTAQAQLFHNQAGLNQASNQATFGTSTSGRKRSRSLTALDAPLHRQNSISIGTTEGYHGEVVPLPPRPTSPNVPAAMEAESLLRADLRSELRITPPGTANREQTATRAIATPSNRLSGVTDGPHVIDPSSHTVFNLAEGAYKKRDSHEERMAAAKARRAEEKRLRGESTEEDIPEDNGEPVPERTRFSMLTADRGESSIHDFIDDVETTAVGHPIPAYRDRDITALKTQLDDILDHLKSSAADRSGRETDILAQVSVLAENTHRSLQQLKDTILEETNVTVGALSYNIERYVGRVVQGPRPYPGKATKGLGKSASYPQDNRTAEQLGPIPGPVKRTTTFFQGIGQALTPASSKATREKKEGMDRLEAMMHRVLDEVEMLKRMKQGARRKTNGEMFKGDARSRLNPPEDAVTYIDEVRGDAANRERGESDEERMARIERSAQDFEEERNKRAHMQNAIATETNIIRQTSNDVRRARQPLPEGTVPYTTSQEEFDHDEGVRRPQVVPVDLQYSTARDTTVDPVTQVPRNTDSPSAESYARGDEGLFTAGRHHAAGQSDSNESNRGEHERVASRISQVNDTARKISIKNPIGLGSSEGAIQSASARESGVLGEHLEDDLGRAQTQSWIDRAEHPSPAPPTPVSKDDRYRGKYVQVLTPINTNTRDYAQVGSSQIVEGPPQRQRSQYFIIDQYGRRQYYIGDPNEKKIDTQPVEKEDGSGWSRALTNIKNGVSPKRNKNKNNKGKEKEVLVDHIEDEQLPVIQPLETTTVEPLPSLFANLDQLETSPSKRLKKRFRKPITTPFDLQDSPVAAPQWTSLGPDTDLPADELHLDMAEKKSKRRSWRDALGFSSHKTQAQSPQEPATMRKASLTENITVTYPGPSQEASEANGNHHVFSQTEDDYGDVVNTVSTQPQPSARAYRDSISDSVKADAMISMKLSDELASGRHPASLEIPADVQWALHQHTQQAQLQQNENLSETSANVVAGPFARRRVNRDFTPTPPMRDPLPASHLIPHELIHSSPYGPTEPLTPQKLQSSAFPARSLSPEDESIYNAAAIRDTMKKSLQRQPTPPKAHVPVARTARVSSNLATQRDVKHPTTFQQQREQLTKADLAQPSNGPVSPSKTDSSYKTAHDGGERERSPDGVRPPSVYSHNSIGGDRFSRTRARTPPDNLSISSADFSSSTRPIDSASAPAKFSYKSGASPPRHSPRSANLSRPSRVSSGPRVEPPNFSNLKTVNREERYSRRSMTASEYTRPTSEETDVVTAVMGKAVRTDLRKGNGSISPSVSPNWARTRRMLQENRKN